MNRKIMPFMLLLIEVIMYLLYVKYFELGEVTLVNFIKEYIFVLFMNIVLLKSERD